MFSCCWCQKLKIAVLGAGHGGHATAADLSLAGNEINLFEIEQFAQNLAPIQKQGTIEIFGAARDGLAKISKVTTDIEDAIKDVDLTMIVTPALAHKTFFEILIPYLEDEQIVMMHPGNWGALEFRKMLKDKGIKKDITLVESTSLIYACRRIGPAKVWVRRIKEWMPIAAYPASRTERVLTLVKGLYPQVVHAANVLETSINEPNFTGHPQAMLLNAARIERGEDFPFFETAQRNPPSCISNIRKTVIAERAKIAEALGIRGDWVTSNFYISDKIERAPPKEAAAHFGRDASYPLHPNQAPQSLNHRYISEDVPYGLVPIEALSSLVNVPSPTITSLITLISVMTQRDYRCEGLTLEKLGLAGLTPEEIRKTLE